MSKETRYTIVTVVIFAFIVGVVLIFLLKPYWEGIRPALLSDEPKTEEVLDELEADLKNGKEDVVQEKPAEPRQYGPFTVHQDYEFDILTREVENPRVMIFDSAGRLIVSEPGRGRVSIISENGDKVEPLLSGLNRPHGLAIKGEHLFVAETGQVIRYDYDVSAQEANNPQVILDLPSGGRHWTRTLGIGPDDGNLYIAIGSSCNICEEEDWRRDKILRYNLDTQELEVYASGLRNAVFFNWHPESGEMYATEMGRDWLGDDLPPDELNLIKEGADYGFPFCYGKQIVDPQYDDQKKCDASEPSFYDFFAHESPLGLDFAGNDMIVALHGSWNRTVPIGYEVIRLSASSGYQERETIISGFLLEDGSTVGRPAGVLISKEGEIYIADDKGGAIYRLTPR